MTRGRRVGILGVHNSHVDHFARLLNHGKGFDGWQLTAACGEPSARLDQLMRDYGLSHPGDEPADLIGHVDAVLVCDRDGARHRSQAEPLLAAGIDVFVDKPFATTVADATALVDAAQRSGAVLCTGSALRYTDAVQRAARKARVSPPTSVVVTGPADPSSEFSGLHFYGVHHAEILLEILGNPPVDDPALVSASHDGSHVVLTDLAGASVTLVFMAPERQGSFRAMVAYGDTVIGVDPSGPAPYGTLLGRFLAACESRTSVSRQEAVAPTVIMEAVAGAVG